MGKLSPRERKSTSPTARGITRQRLKNVPPPEDTYVLVSGTYEPNLTRGRERSLCRSDQSKDFELEI